MWEVCKRFVGEEASASLTSFSLRFSPASGEPVDHILRHTLFPNILRAHSYLRPGIWRHSSASGFCNNVVSIYLFQITCITLLLPQSYFWSSWVQIVHQTNYAIEKLHYSVTSQSLGLYLLLRCHLLIVNPEWREVSPLQYRYLPGITRIRKIFSSSDRGR